MIIIIVLILAVISGIFMYNKFQQQELKELTVIPKVFHIAFNLRFFSIKHPLKIYSY